MDQLAIHSVAVAPRLNHCVTIIDRTVSELQVALAAESDSRIRQEMQSSLEAILTIRDCLGNVSCIDTIPSTLPPVIPVVRAIAARLSPILSSCCNSMCELAIHLGSMIMDSAILAGVQVNLAWCHVGLNADNNDMPN